jgi:membrane-bound lytic murein transglycosylase B
VKLASIPVVVLLLGAAVVGCGGSQAARATTRLPGDASALARQIDRAQATIDDPSAPTASLAKAARSQQLAFRDLADDRRLRRATLARLSRPAARSAALAALRATGAVTHIVPRELRFPHWRIASPPPPAVLLEYFEEAAARYALAWQYLAAIELVETRMGRIHGLSPAGAKGPMQFMPATWAEYGHGSIDNQRGAIMAAARFLAANGAHRNISAALLHYNPSHSYVVAVES